MSSGHVGMALIHLGKQKETSKFRASMASLGESFR